MLSATPWNGLGTPPPVAVLLPDVFGFPVMPADVVAGEQSNRAIAAILARVAAHPECRVYLPTEHVERPRAWFRWIDGSADGDYDIVLPVEYGVEFEWPLPNLTLCAPVADLDALLDLPAAAHGVWVRMEADADACFAGYYSHAGRPARIAGGQRGCAGTTRGIHYHDDLCGPALPILLDGGPCETCYGTGAVENSLGRLHPCTSCMGRHDTGAIGDGLAPWARALCAAAETAGVDVVRCERDGGKNER